MLDHVHYPVSDYARSKAFYLRALAPLGYGLAIEVSPEQTGGGSQGGFGPGRPQFWIGTGKPVQGQVHFAFMAKDRAAVRAFYDASVASWRQGQRAAGIAAAVTPIITAPSFWTPTGTISRPCATCRSNIRPQKKVRGRRRYRDLRPRN